MSIKKIYTKQGDRGKTTICGMIVEKNNLRLIALGVLDELSSSLGLVLAFDPKLKILEDIQRDLLEIGASLGFSEKDIGQILGKRTLFLEKEIDRMWENLPPLENFILPGGGKAGGQLHVARAFCRRAEREIVSLSRQEKIQPEILIYLNRLSDFLYVLARWVNQKEGYPEKIWRA